MTETSEAKTGHIRALSTPQSARTQVADALRAAVVAGELRPGRIYSAPKLAAQLGTSATPVREAVLDLAGDGLVEMVRNKGFKVKPLTNHELDCLAEIRTMTEVPAMVEVARACSGDTATAVEALRPTAHRIVDAADRGDLIAYIESDTEFHLQFLSLHGNERLVKLVRELRSRSRLYGLEALANAGALGPLAADHEAMVDAALDNDPDRMHELIGQHLRKVRSVWAEDPGEQAVPHDGALTSQQRVETPTTHEE